MIIIPIVVGLFLQLAQTVTPTTNTVRVVHRKTQIVALEGPLGATATKLALQPGEYTVDWTKDGQSGHLALDVADGQECPVFEANLVILGTRWTLPVLKEPTLGTQPQHETAARAELTLFQTLHGIGVGAETCAIGKCDDPRLWGLTLTLGAGAGLAGSLLSTRQGITSGETLAIDSGTAWGYWQAVVVTSVSEYVQDHERLVPATMLSSQLLGLGAGIGVAALWSPKAGQVSLANTFGIWSGAIALLINSAADTQNDDAVMLSVLAASDVGLLAGVFAGQQVEMSRGRTLVIDAGGLLGMLGGMGTALMLNLTAEEQRRFFGAAIAGTLIGLGTTAYLTQDWDIPEIPAQVMVAPVNGGALALVGMNF